MLLDIIMVSKRKERLEDDRKRAQTRSCQSPAPSKKTKSSALGRTFSRYYMASRADNGRGLGVQQDRDDRVDCSPNRGARAIAARARVRELGRTGCRVDAGRSQNQREVCSSC